MEKNNVNALNNVSVSASFGFIANNNPYTVKILDDRIAKIVSLFTEGDYNTSEIETLFSNYLKDRYFIEEENLNTIKRNHYHYWINTAFNNYIQEIGCYRISFDLVIRASISDSNMIEIEIGLTN